MLSRLQKNCLHYYVDLIRMREQEQRDEEHSEFCLKSLNNIIRTMRLSRHDKVCGEDFSQLDFGNTPLNDIRWSLNGKHASVFRNCRINTNNILSGNRHRITAGCFSPDNSLVATIGHNEAVIWDYHLGTQINKLTRFLKYIKNSAEKPIYYFQNNDTFVIETDKNILKWNFRNDARSLEQISRSEKIHSRSSAPSSDNRYELKYKKHKLYIRSKKTNSDAAVLDVFKHLSNGQIYQNDLLNDRLLIVLLYTKGLDSENYILSVWDVSESIKRYEKSNRTTMLSEENILDKINIDSQNYIITRDKELLIYISDNRLKFRDIRSGTTSMGSELHNTSETLVWNKGTMEYSTYSHNYFLLDLSSDRKKLLILDNDVPVVLDFPSMNFCRRFGGNIIDYEFYLLHKKQQAVIFFQYMSERILYDIEQEKIIDRCDLHNDKMPPLWAIGYLYYTSLSQGHSHRASEGFSDLEDTKSFSFFGVPNLYVMDCDFTGCSVDDDTMLTIIHQQGGII